MADYVTAISVGVPFTMTQNVAHALPARLCYVFSKDAVTFSGEVGGTYVALTGANTLGVYCAGGFVKSAAVGTVILCKP